jgi:hypothetical protein
MDPKMLAKKKEGGYLEPVPRERQGSFSTAALDWPLTASTSNSSTNTVNTGGYGYNVEYCFTSQEFHCSASDLAFLGSLQMMPGHS